jgi:hypothetical protein
VGYKDNNFRTKEKGRGAEKESGRKGAAAAVRGREKLEIK